MVKRNVLPPASRATLTMKVSRMQISHGLYHTRSPGRSGICRSHGWALAGQNLALEPIAHACWCRVRTRRGQLWATGGEMKVLLVLMLVMAGAATALAFANATVGTS